MINHKTNFYIITGGPGVGKTTLLDELARRGYHYVPEVARDIIRQQIATGGDALPWADARKYSDMMLSRSVDDFVRLSVSDELYFFDRGIPDTYGYERLIGLDMSEKLKEAVAIYRYNPVVFILPAWKEIYETDSERKQDFEEAVATYHVMTEIYSELGYTPVEVPTLPVKERADFVLNQLGI
ncbi:putative ATPase [Dysgonomonas sp. PFB1-18]|uniref:AAA family ATPase n=1 Tax=unclassified Dysgonomonas TaxID=2630389 RepID=UPI002476E3A5|nr:MULTISPECIES: AAA family ATPase [unclassified Dysgonomonas]MDH6308694.1 putative ATPase [Dysgonomonas sp. PF1-14]MDH6338609.1 putative ATPase [Dysgonomonas sp. PF1-16]MDH6379943.1 putative ATPase [Dysgonomonas sp. PFB1-18]MDH6397437.1 putative ATPase [Dysgonomonas sp. PF1-23]